MFYRITYNIDQQKETPQIITSELGYNWNGACSMSRVRFNRPINFDIVFPIFNLTNKSGVTDLVSNSYDDYNFLTLSSKAMALMALFNIDYGSRHKVQIKKGIIRMNYYMLYCSYDRIKDVFAWEQCSFSLYDQVTRKLTEQNVCFKDYKSYRKWHRSESTIAKFSELVVKNNWDKDLFRLTMPYNEGAVPYEQTTFCCSSKLKEAIEASDLTGFKFDELKA